MQFVSVYKKILNFLSMVELQYFLIMRVSPLEE